MKYYIDFNGKIVTVNIKTYCNDFMGYNQGYKVFINGKKYPKKYGHHYTSLNKNNCIYYAIKDFLKGVK